MQHSIVLSYLCHNFPLLTNRNVVAATTGHIHWMIVVLCWSQPIGCERDNDVLLFHARISVLTLQCCVTAMVVLLGGMYWRRTQQKAEGNVMLQYGNWVWECKRKGFADIEISFDICEKNVHKASILSSKHQKVRPKYAFFVFFLICKKTARLRIT